MEDRVSQTPPKPRLALTIGIIGHRPNRLPEAARDKVAADVAGVLDRLSAEAKFIHGVYEEFFTHDDPLLSLASALAEGADRMAAKTALERGWTLDVVLPFHPSVYRADFETPESNAAFDDLLRHARSVLELPGDRKDETHAYEAVGLNVLDQSDIVLAVWDRGPSGGGGGTTEMLEAAVRFGIPIIHVDAKGEAPPHVLWSELSDFPAQVDAIDQLPVKNLDEGLKALIERLVQPPAPEAERHALKRYFRECLSTYRTSLQFPLLMAACGVRSMRQSDWQPLKPDVLADELLALGKSTPDGEKPSEPAFVALAYGWADAVGIRFAQVFRSAFVTNFLLASITVVAAALSLLFNHDKKYAFVSFELVFILIVLVTTFVGRWHGWHQRWFEPREVAERLRIARVLWTLGARPTSFSGREPVWTGWYARAIVREQGLRTGVFNEDTLSVARSTLLALLHDQCAYHRTTHARMEKLETRLEFIGLILFSATALTAAAFLLFVLGGCEIVKDEKVTFWATALAAGLPALATASYGIRVIGDFEGIARRSERTYKALKQLIEAIEHDALTLRQLITAVKHDALALNRLRNRARSAAEVMLGDVSSWRVATESRTLNIPG